MGLSESLMPEFDQEMAFTRKTLERVPDEKLDWQPHGKSMTFAGLVTHLVNLPSWTVLTIEDNRFDMTPLGADPPRRDPVPSMEAALEIFKKNVVNARSALLGAGDEHLRSDWSLLAGGETIFTLPRIAVIRNMVLNHMIHHRAQLGIYLRLIDLPVPMIYGPTADEEK